MNSKKGYRVLFHLMNSLFWFLLATSVIGAMITTYILFDSSILKEISGIHFAISEGVLGINLDNYTPDVQLLQFTMVCAIIVMFFVTMMFWNFRVLFENASKGFIFVDSSTKSIFSIGIILLIQSFASSLPKVYIAAKMTPFVHITNGSFKVSYSINELLFITAIFILFLGVFFKQAVAIAQENELTV
ncbi:DUF2975 domain-containing protein [Priestia sp. FSL R5-0597]|uniref:DUF2975 domain-containing protein n=1 Tax=Priestia TaxID=2800373 RepID=UPI0012B9DBD9|nr:DUF2975 domain-containing protein [Priestia megaterium]